MNVQKNSWQKSSHVFNTRAYEYDSWFENSLLFAIENAAIKALAVPVTTPALEIGVGSGRFAQTLGSDFGIDPANAPLHIASRRDIKVCQAVGETLPFFDNSFSMVSMFFTLCFVQNPAQVLDETYRVLQRDGHFLLGFVPSTSQWGKSLLKKQEAGHPFYKYAHFFTIEAVKILVHHSRFSIQNVMSSLYQAPESVTSVETPHPGMDEFAGFIALHLTKL
jgi:ubiquinone/menaquinone biosynthesis C-methylase UbiE